MNTKITPIDKKNGIRGEWSVYNSGKNTRLNFTVQFVCESHFQRKQVQTPRTQPNNNKTFEIMEILFYPSISSFLQLFYIVGCFFLHLLLLCVSKVIKMCWRKSQWRICRYIYFFSCGSQHERNNFLFSQRKQHASKGPTNALIEDYMEKYKKTKMKKNIQFFSYIFLIFFSLSSIFPFNLCFSARRCVPFHLLHVLVIMCSWENFCTRM